MEYEHDNHHVHLIVSHLIFCPRRRKVLVGSMRERWHQIMQEVAAKNSWKVLALALQPDRVQLFVRSNPRTLPTDIARLIKGRSAHLLREEYPCLKRLPKLGTRSTCYSTAGNVSSETIQTAIERQCKA